jgi:predicted DsbA family dithiol-disulfide isomerase
MVVIDYFSDILCVWAWIAQRRLDELHSHYGDQIVVHHRYMDIFGAVDSKMSKQWADRGSYAGFAEHVQNSVVEYKEAPVHADNWRHNRPTSSAMPHLYIKALELTGGRAAAESYAAALRRVFFVEAGDISSVSVLEETLEYLKLSLGNVQSALQNGTAMASLMADYQSARQLNLRGSPSYVMNNERQILYGNVGYRVLSANVEELLREVEHEASWC